ncbi:MAG: DUF983 domain-containing protein [Rickettsiales bacterium]|nr:DUF983 domain-containing protein [Rickettsiales bacterium]
MSDSPAPPSLAYCALACRCPNCGRGKLYRSLLQVAPACSECGLDFTRHEQGDGPAFLAILLVGALVAISAAVIDIKLQPPLWLHAALWPPVVAIGSPLSLRWLKSALIATQFRMRKDDFNND